MAYGCGIILLYGTLYVDNGIEIFKLQAADVEKLIYCISAIAGVVAYFNRVSASPAFAVRADISHYIQLARSIPVKTVVGVEGQSGVYIVLACSLLIFYVPIRKVSKGGTK